MDDHPRMILALSPAAGSATVPCCLSYRSMTTAPAAGLTLAGQAEWIEGKGKAKAGHQIIVADPITAAIENGDKPWVAAQTLINRCALCSNSVDGILSLVISCIFTCETHDISNIVALADNLSAAPEGTT